MGSCRGKTGYIYKFEVYIGKQEVPENELAYGVVFQLMDDLLEYSWPGYRTVTIFYTSPRGIC